MTPRPVDGGPGPTVLRARPPRRPRRWRVIIALSVLAAAGLMVLGLVLSDSHPLLGMLLTIAVGMNVANFAYGLWAAGQGRVTVDGDELVVRPGRVLTQRYRLRDGLGVEVGASRWRSDTLSLSDGRKIALPSLSEQDQQHLVELLAAAAERRPEPPPRRRARAAPHRARAKGEERLSEGAGRGGAVRAPGAARWPDLPPPG